MSQTIGQDGQSFFGYAGIAEENTYGTGVDPTEFINVVSDGFSGENNPIYLDTIRGRDTYEAVAGEFNDDGSIDSPVTPEAIGLLLKAAFGESSVTTSDPDGDTTDEVGTHTFTTSDKVPSLSVELGLGNITAVRHTGVGVESLDLEHSAGDRLSLSTDLPAKEPDGSVSRSTPAYDNLRALVFHDSTFTLFGSDRTVDLRDLTFSLTNSLSAEIRGERTPSKMTVGGREITWDVTIDFENTEVMESFWGSVGATGPEKELFEGALNAKWVSPETIEDTSTQYSLELDAPRNVIDTHDAQLDRNELIAENVEIRTLVDVGNAGYDVQATLTNGRMSAY
jgi:hypothetical protein